MGIKNNKTSKCVYLKKDNKQYVKQEADKMNQDFSTTLNQIIEERRFNEQFNSCQNNF